MIIDVTLKPDIVAQYNKCRSIWGLTSLPGIEDMHLDWVSDYELAGETLVWGVDVPHRFGINFSSLYIRAIYILAPDKIDRVWDELVTHELAHIAQAVIWPRITICHNSKFRDLMYMAGYTVSGPFLTTKRDSGSGKCCLLGTDVESRKVYNLAKLLKEKEQEWTSTS
jgi:hypothetical protein